MTIAYPFTLPISGKELEWRPLPIGPQLDIAAQHSQNPANVESALLIAHICKYDNKDGAPPPVEWRNWDDLDYLAFSEEVDTKKKARLFAFQKKRAGENIPDQVKAAAMAYQEAANNMGKLLKMLLETMGMQQAVADPLGPK